MNNKPLTPAEIEQAEKDSLYIALILRQRVRNAEAIRNDTMIRMGRDPGDLIEPPTVALSVSEADILLKHFSGYAEKNMQLAGQLAATQKDAGIVAERLADVRKQGEKWERDARHANNLIGRAMHLFARDQWRVEKQEDLGWMIHTPRVEGMAAHTVIWEDSENPAEALLALLLDAVIEDNIAGDEGPIIQPEKSARRVILPAGHTMSCEPTRYIAVSEVARLLQGAGFAVDVEEPDE